MLRLSGIHAGYQDEAVLKEISLSIHERDFIGVIGPNGGGKTTLLRLILGLLKPWKGFLKYSAQIQDKGFKRIGYLPQDIGLDARFPATVEDVVTTGMMKPGWFNRRKGIEDKVVGVLAKVGIQNLKNESIGALSGGQRQKVLLARAIIDDPLLLILDEPDTFTDQRFENELYALLKQLNDEMAIVMVSHDLGIISSHVKTIACVNGGLHYHPTNQISQEMLDAYECPIDIITHGHLPHRVLGEH